VAKIILHVKKNRPPKKTGSKEARNQGSNAYWAKHVARRQQGSKEARKQGINASLTNHVVRRQQGINASLRNQGSNV